MISNKRSGGVVMPKQLMYELCNLCNLDEVHLGVLCALDLAEICLLHHGDSGEIVSEPAVHVKGNEKSHLNHICIS